MMGGVGFLRGWTRRDTADGAIFVPPGGDQGDLIRVRERLPLVRFRDLVDDIVRYGGDLTRAATVSPLERFTTDEGEHAGLVTITNLPPAFQRTLVLLAADDHATLVDGVTHDPGRFAEHRAAVRDLARGFYLGLGALRRRRYLHRPPPAWIAVARPHAVRYLHPDYPRAGASIIVFDASPSTHERALDDYRRLMIESRDDGAPLPAQQRGELVLHDKLIDGPRLPPSTTGCAPSSLPHPAAAAADHPAIEHWVD